MHGRDLIQICGAKSRVGAQRLLVADGGHVVLKITINPVRFVFLRGRGKSRQHTGEGRRGSRRHRSLWFLHAGRIDPADSRSEELMASSAARIPELEMNRPEFQNGTLTRQVVRLGCFTKARNYRQISTGNIYFFCPGGTPVSDLGWPSLLAWASLGECRLCLRATAYLSIPLRSAQDDTTNNLNGIRIAWCDPQGLKPCGFCGFTARLKSLPFHKNRS